MDDDTPPPPPKPLGAPADVVRPSGPARERTPTEEVAEDWERSLQTKWDLSLKGPGKRDTRLGAFLGVLGVALGFFFLVYVPLLPEHWPADAILAVLAYTVAVHAFAAVGRRWKVLAGYWIAFLVAFFVFGATCFVIVWAVLAGMS